MKLYFAISFKTPIYLDLAFLSIQSKPWWATRANVGTCLSDKLRRSTWAHASLRSLKRLPLRLCEWQPTFTFENLRAHMRLVSNGNILEQLNMCSG